MSAPDRIPKSKPLSRELKPRDIMGEHKSVTEYYAKVRGTTNYEQWKYLWSGTAVEDLNPYLPQNCGGTAT